MPVMNDDKMDQHVEVIPHLIKIKKFSERTKFPLANQQLNFIYGSRQIGKTIARVIETLSYIDEQPNYVNWAGSTDFITDVGPDGLPTAWIHIDRGRQDWDQMADEFKDRHMQDISFVDFIYTNGYNYGKRMINLFAEIIHSMEENKNHGTRTCFTFNGKPVIFNQTKRTIFFEVNYHLLRFVPLHITTRKLLGDTEWLTNFMKAHQKNMQGIPVRARAGKTITDVDIQF